MIQIMVKVKLLTFLNWARKQATWYNRVCQPMVKQIQLTPIKQSWVKSKNEITGKKQSLSAE